MRDRRGRLSLVAALVVMFAGASVPMSTAQIPVGGWTSPNVDWLGNVNLSGTTGAITGLRHGKYFYAEGLEAIEIFNISDPVAPDFVARLPLQPRASLPGALGIPDYGRDEVDTNGEILITSWADASGEIETLVVYDVTSKAAPRVVGRLDGAGLGFTCIARCRWAYAATGEIVDLTDPSSPELAGNWAKNLTFAAPPNPTRPNAYDVTEVALGRVLTASMPMYLLDVSRPTNPRVLARSDGSPHSLGGTVIWPAMHSNDIAMSVSQSYLMPRCELQNEFAGSSFDSAFKTWETSDWETTRLITGGSEYRLRNGTYGDGNPAVSGAAPFFWGCGTTEVDAHRDFRNGGLVAVSGSSHGVKFLEIDQRGGIEEVGWFLPHANDTFGAYWITDEIVYTVDWPRGIDILRFDPNA